MKVSYANDGIPPTLFWRHGHADQMAVVVNGRSYLRAAKEAMLQAQHSIMLIGWDFDARVNLEPDGQTLEGPAKVGDFLNWLADERPGLKVRLLKWDLGILRSLGRGQTPLFVLDWMGHRNVQLRLDSAHSPLAAHHTKLLVIDDVLAFCGGIDMAVGRWDTREHIEVDPSRTSPAGKPLPPWHDVSTCLAGGVVRDLGELARERWLRATGEQLKAPPRVPAIWPSTVPVQYRNLGIGIARTSGAFRHYRQISEIQKVTLKLIESAERTLYIENQYLASRKIAEALALRLREPTGPEIVIIMPETADGWLAAKAMDSARSRLLHLLRKSDVFGRFRAYFPVNENGTSVYVHAKVLIADGRYLKIGSANLNNRSMGFDTECDIVLDALRAFDEGATRKTILDCRVELLSEHLSLPRAAVQTEIAENPSLIGAIDALNKVGRLRHVEARSLKPAEELIAETDLVDPEEPAKLSSNLPNPWSLLTRTLGF